MGKMPSNINIVCDVPFSEIRALFAGARVVVLPVKENTYSGATTTLLQAMAMGKPIVASRVGATREGYGLRDGENSSACHAREYRRIRNGNWTASF